MTGGPAGEGVPDLRRLLAGVRAVLSDLEGVLVDTGPWWHGVRVEWAAARGLAWTDDDSRACMGRSSREWADLPIADLGGDGA